MEPDKLARTGVAEYCAIKVAAIPLMAKGTVGLETFKCTVSLVP